MKRSIYLLLLLLMAQAGNLFAQSTDRTAAAESVLRQLKNGCGDSLYAASTPQVQGQLKAESYNAIWQQLEMQAGTLQGSARGFCQLCGPGRESLPRPGFDD